MLLELALKLVRGGAARLRCGAAGSTGSRRRRPRPTSLTRAGGFALNVARLTNCRSASIALSSQSEESHSAEGGLSRLTVAMEAAARASGAAFELGCEVASVQCGPAGHLGRREVIVTAKDGRRDKPSTPSGNARSFASAPPLLSSHHRKLELLS